MKNVVIWLALSVLGVQHLCAALPANILDQSTTPSKADGSDNLLDIKTQKDPNEPSSTAPQIEPKKIVYSSDKLTDLEKIAELEQQFGIKIGLNLTHPYYVRQALIALQTYLPYALGVDDIIIGESYYPSYGGGGSGSVRLDVGVDAGGNLHTEAFLNNEFPYAGGIYGDNAIDDAIAKLCHEGAHALTHNGTMAGGFNPKYTDFPRNVFETTKSPVSSYAEASIDEDMAETITYMLMYPEEAAAKASQSSTFKVRYDAVRNYYAKHNTPMPTQTLATTPAYHEALKKKGLVKF